MVTISQRSIIDEQTELLSAQQKQIRFYQAQLALVRVEAEAELARIEMDGGTSGFAQRILKLAEDRA